MENTDALLFDTSVRLFVMHSGSLVGPISLPDVVARLRRNEISWVDFACEAQNPKWQRLSEMSEFQGLLPAEPQQSAEEILAAASLQTRRADVGRENVSGEKIWYLYDRSSQSGPYTDQELVALTQGGVLTSQAFVWRDGWVDWVLASEREGFVQPRKRGTDFRAGPRKPLVARVFVAGQTDVVLGVCRDVSIGGMQVLADHSPGPLGSLVKLNVNPSEGMGPFVAEAVIVRMLEDGRGFSLRFTRLDPDAISGIEEYLRWA